MSDRDKNIDAAERALGTLSRKGETPRGAKLRQAWEFRLATLLSPIREVAPPPGFFSRISQQLDHQVTLETLARSRRKERRWKGISALAGMAIAGLAAFIVVQPRLAPEGERYVAIVTSDADGTPGMVVQFDTGTGIATVVPVVGSTPEGRSWQMWHLPVGAEKPVSIGLLPEDPDIKPAVTAGVGDTFAISIEQEGGSPTGQPTDARYHGKIVRID